MDSIKEDDSGPLLPSLRLSPEQARVLSQFCLRHQGVPEAVKPSPWPLATFFTLCLAAIVGLIWFPGSIPPFYTTLLLGFALGFITSRVRIHQAFERIWPLLELIIDWSHATHMMKMSMEPGILESSGQDGEDFPAPK